jgi:hypothetical protein
MLFFKANFHEGLVSGAVTLTFRLWDRPRVKSGSMQRCHPIGVLEVGEISDIAVAAITAADAARAGFANRDALLAYLAEAATEKLTPVTRVYRVEVRFAGDGDMAANATDAHLSAEDVTAIDHALAALDRKAAPWTRAMLALIERHPRVVASKLAAMVGRETPPFKTDVVKLKKLGLTISFSIGYELSPRGRAYLEANPRADVRR